MLGSVEESSPVRGKAKPCLAPNHAQHPNSPSRGECSATQMPAPMAKGDQAVCTADIELFLAQSSPFCSHSAN